MDTAASGKGNGFNNFPNVFGGATSEVFPLEEITHCNYTHSVPVPAHVNNNNTAYNFSAARNSSEDYSSEPLSIGPITDSFQQQPGSSNPVSNLPNGFPSPSSSSSSSDDDVLDDDDEVTQYHRYDHLSSASKTKPGKKQKDLTTIRNNNNYGRQTSSTASNISDDNFPSILNSNAVVASCDVLFSILILAVTSINFSTDLALVCWHYVNGHSWYSAFTAIIMTFGACSILHQFSINDTERLKRIFDSARRVRILTNCFPTCGSIISSYYLCKTARKAKLNQMYALQYFSHEEFLQNLLRLQSFFQAAPQAILQLLILMETIHEISLEKGIFILFNILISITIMMIGNVPNRSEEFDSAIRPGAYSPTTRVFIGLRIFACFASRTMSIVYILLGINCLLGKFSSLSTLESFFLSFSIILIPRTIFIFVDFFYRKFYRNGPSTATTPFSNVSCGRITLGYLATIFFPMSDPLWIFWFIWFETICFILFGNIVGWLNSTECIDNLVNSIYTGTFIVLFIVIPIFLPFARAKAKKRQLKRLEDIFERKQQRSTNQMRNLNPSTSTSNAANPTTNEIVENKF